jgi:hypothetical protein
MPAKEKISKMTVCLDKSMGGTDLAEIEFNMADFKFGEYKMVRLFLKKCASNTTIDFDLAETFLDIALKGTKANGLASKRHSLASKPSMVGLSRSGSEMNSQSQKTLITPIDPELRGNNNSET